jgi:hypothetical protein
MSQNKREHMINGDIEHLIEKRLDWVRVSKANAFDFDTILAGLYNDPSHFIYEILQNAEDAHAKKVYFQLFADRLDIVHNGIEFDFKDIDGVTGIGISKKKEDLNFIGKFGVGFKSVFAVTKTPYIFSGDYRIKIEDFVVPAHVSEHELVAGTLIRLPFNHDLRPKEEVFDLVSRKLENIGLKTLLFLNSIEEIRWETPAATGHCLKSSSEYQGISNTKRVTIISENDIEEYIVLERPIKVDSKPLTVAVAYKLGKNDNGKEIIVQEPDSKLVVFFPTEKVTFLNFLVQGPYKTTPNRENIPLEDEQNKLLIDETAGLIGEGLSVIKTLGYLDINFLNTLPIAPEHRGKEVIYSALYSKVKEKLLTDEELLPTFDGRYAKSSDALLARGKGLAEFLEADDIEMLFARCRWLDTGITYDKTRILRDFLTDDLDIDEVDFEDFAKRVSADFLISKPDEWMIDFYGRLLDQPALWRDKTHSPKPVLRSKPIIRLESGEHVAPFDDNNKVQVYLPSETKSQYRTVKGVLADHEEALRFLKDLGLTKPDVFAEIREFILPKYQRGDAVRDESYFEDFEKLLTAYGAIASSKKNDFVEQLTRANFIGSYSRARGGCLCKPSDTYLREASLIQYFDNDDTVCFVVDELYQKLGKERLNSFLMELGVDDKPRRIEIDSALSWEEKSKLRGNSGCTREICCKDYEYSNLEYLLEHITPEKSYRVWKFLLKSIAALNSWEARQFFQGEYRWFWRSEHTERFDAKFLKMLREKEWLTNKEGIFQKPCDLTFSDLPGSYTKESPNVDTLLKTLGFKPDAIDRLPDEYKTKLELVKDYSLEDLQRLISEDKERNRLKRDENPGDWIPDREPKQVPISLIEVPISTIVTKNLEGQEGRLKVHEEPQQEEEQKNDDKPIDQHDKKKIGDWGEEYVFCALRSKYQQDNTISETDFGFKVVSSKSDSIEVIWLNKHKNVGKGYDFVIKMNGEEIEYIEVKTKTKEAEELIDITGTQWEFARRLHENNEGENYSVYVVSNAGTSNAQIRILKNPIGLWKEGKLYAHPVKFRL